MTLKHALIAFSLIFTFMSCDNDSNNGDDNPIPESSILLKERIINYDGDILTEVFSYDGNFLTSIIDSEGFKYEYIYDNDMLVRINSIAPNQDITDYTLLEYNSSNKLASYTVYISSGTEGLKFDLTYNADGTITEKEYSGDHNAQTNLINETIITRNNGQTQTETTADFVTSYDYDTKNGIYKNIANIETLSLINIDFSGYIDSSENNLLTETNNSSGTNSVFLAYQYTYNASNFPETATYYYDGALESTIQYIYE